MRLPTAVTFVIVVRPPLLRPLHREDDGVLRAARDVEDDVARRAEATAVGSVLVLETQHIPEHAAQHAECAERERRSLDRGRCSSFTDCSGLLFRSLAYFCL